MLTRKAGIVASAVAAATAIAYVILIASQGENDVGLVILVVAMISGAAVAAGVGASSSDLIRRRVSLGVASGLLLSLGVLAIFSIGLLLLVAGVASTIAWVRAMTVDRTGARGWSLLAFLGGVALPFVLLLLQEN